MKDTIEIHCLKTKKNRDDALNFLTTEKCLNLYLFEGIVSKSSTNHCYAVYNHTTIHALLYSRQGTHIHMHIKKSVTSVYIQQIAFFLNKTFPSAVSLFGERDILLPFISGTLFTPRRIRDYNTMVLKKGDFRPHIFYGTKRLNVSNDAVSLSELQVQYEIEELGVNPHQINKNAVIKVLTMRMQRGEITALYDGSRPIAIAGVNARFLDTCQIGSVYVIPSYRRKGIGTSLISSHAANLLQNYRKIVLFVDINNQQAAHIYKKVGFHKAGTLLQAYLK